jgi:hypothetical protein
MGASQFFCTLSNCSLKILGVLVDCFFTTTFILPYKLMRNSMNMRTIWVDKSILKHLNHPLLWNPFFQSLKIPWQMGVFKRVKILSIMEKLFKGLSILEGQKVWSCDWWNLNPKFPKWQKISLWSCNFFVNLVILSSPKSNNKFVLKKHDFASNFNYNNSLDHRSSISLLEVYKLFL